MFGILVGCLFNRMGCFGLQLWNENMCGSFGSLLAGGFLF